MMPTHLIWATRGMMDLYPGRWTLEADLWAAVRESGQECKKLSSPCMQDNSFFLNLGESC